MTHDAEGPEGDRRPPRLGAALALLLTAGVAGLATSIDLATITYGAFLPEWLLSGAFSGWLGTLVGLALPVALLTVGRLWRPTGLQRLRPRRDAWTLLPLLGLVVAGVLVGDAQFGQILQNPALGASYLVAVTLTLLTAVLLELALVPWLVAGSFRGRPQVAVVLVAGLAVGLGVVGLELAAALSAPPEFGPAREPARLATAVLAQGLIVLPYVAVALRTGAPWVLAPVLAVTQLTIGPTGAWFWAYAALGAAYAVLLALTAPAGEVPRDA